jgi:hypothetical protein
VRIAFGSGTFEINHTDDDSHHELLRRDERNPRRVPDGAAVRSAIPRDTRTAALRAQADGV